MATIRTDGPARHSSRLRYEAFRSRRYARFSTPWTSSLHRISKPFDSLRRGVDARICFLFVLCQLLGGYRASGPRDRKSTTSELQSLMRISYAVFCLKKKKQTQITSKI